MLPRIHPRKLARPTPAHLSSSVSHPFPAPPLGLPSHSEAAPMASSTMAGGAYATFLGLPGIGRGGAAASVSDIHLPADSATAADLDRADGVAKAAFDLARRVLEDQEKWEEAQQREETARRERKELLRVPDTSAAAAASAGGGGGRGEPAARPTTQATLFFHLPDGRVTSEGFEVSQGAFDVYSKIFGLLQDKERQFFSNIKGPRDGGPRVDKKLDDGSFSLDLKSLGVQAGKQYDVSVTQPRS